MRSAIWENRSVIWRDRSASPMQDIVREHEAKRKQEFDTLQSQINPHFLYNTLDIIVWMIENEQKTEAVKGGNGAGAVLPYQFKPRQELNYREG